MGARIRGVVLMIVALGLVVYFMNTGGSRVGSALHLGGSTSTQASSSASPTNATSTSFWSSFFQAIFRGVPPPRPIGYSGTGTFYITSPSGSTGISGAGQTSQSGSDVTSGNASSGGSGSTISPYDIPSGFTLAQLSPYFHQVRFSGVSTYAIGLSGSGYYHYANATSTPIDITGWQIKTNRGGDYVPQAVNIYNPSAVPVTSDIVFIPGSNDVAYLYSTSAPINLRLNTCMGYLNATNQFNPPLPSSCPSIDQSAITDLTGACQNYILSLGCRTTDFGAYNFPRNDYQCEDYLQGHFTYQSCISDHAHDANFLSNEWHIWMGSSPLDPYHDKVRLLDKNGLLVDYYAY